MRICIDGTPFENDFQLGIWRYVYETARRLSAACQMTLWLGDEPRQPLPQGVSIVRDSTRTYLPAWKLPRRAGRIMGRLRPASGLRESTLFHSTYFALPTWTGSRHVVTVHDMIAEREFPICTDWCADLAERKRRSFEAADCCICVSQATADDLVSFYPELGDRVRVVHHGADHLVPKARPGRQSDLSADPFVLFVGQRAQYKNFWLVIDAMRTAAWPAATILHVVGDPPSSQERTLVARYGLSGRVTFLGRLNDQALAEQYANAGCFIFPSLLEGFGLPLLEAQAHGCPVVASDIPVFREVAAGAAVYFDPRIAERLADAITETFDEGGRRTLVEAGFENVPRFTWDRTAEGTLQVYREVLENLR